MNLFDAMHEGLRWAEAQFERARFRAAGWRMPSREALRPAQDRFRSAVDRVGQGDLGPVVAVAAIAIAVLLAAAVLPVLVPMALVIAVLWVLMAFAWTWSREFLTLMRLDDADFPGRFDKLIWGLLLIFAPPVGVWAFRSFRERYWGWEKPAQPAPEV